MKVKSKLVKSNQTQDIKEIKKIEGILKSPKTLFSAEVITGLIGSNPQELGMSAGRIVQTAIKNRFIKQLLIEILELRKKGQLNEDYIESEYGQKSLADILNLIDEENVDPKKLDAIKALFKYTLLSSTDEIKRKKAYYLTQTCLKLTAFDIEVISVCYEIYKIPNNGTDSMKAAGDWINKVSETLGYDLPQYVEQSEERLIEYGILSDRTYSDRSGIIKSNTMRLTKLGVALCEIISNDDYKS